MDGEGARVEEEAAAAEGEEVVEIVELRREVEDWVGTFGLPWTQE